MNQSLSILHLLAKNTPGRARCSCVSFYTPTSFQRRRFTLSVWRMNSSEVPDRLPRTGCVDLTPLRGLLALHGPDAAKFLQGLITKVFPSPTERHGMFAAFLSPQVSRANGAVADVTGTSSFRCIY